jgi:hypothetical protein
VPLLCRQAFQERRARLIERQKPFAEADVAGNSLQRELSPAPSTCLARRAGGHLSRLPRPASLKRGTQEADHRVGDLGELHATALVAIGAGGTDSASIITACPVALEFPREGSGTLRTRPRLLHYQPTALPKVVCEARDGSACRGRVSAVSTGPWSPLTDLRGRGQTTAVGAPTTGVAQHPYVLLPSHTQYPAEAGGGDLYEASGAGAVGLAGGAGKPRSDSWPKGRVDPQEALGRRAGLRRWCCAVRGLTVPLGRSEVLQKRWVALHDTNHLDPAATLAPGHRCGAVRVSRGVGGRAGERGRSALLTNRLGKYHGSLPSVIVLALRPRSRLG